MINKILAIVVVYNKTIIQSDSIMSLNNDLMQLEQKLDVYIYDNSLAPTDLPELERINFVCYNHDSSNAGVSRAYNEGVKYASSIGKEWVLLLDQDTKFEKGAIECYIQSLEAYPEIKLFCPLILLENSIIFSPFRRKLKRGVSLRHVNFVKYDLKKFSPVNSGMLINIGSFIECGGYNDAVKLDFSDLEFIERFSKKNGSFLLIRTKAIQDFSNNETNVDSLNRRFLFFCQGARNCEKRTLLDKIEYLIVVFVRATMLTIRTKKIVFYRTFLNEYLK